MSVTIGTVETFPDVRPDKAQAVKLLEEAAEVFAAWQVWDDRARMFGLSDAIDECADLIQATSNLLAGLGVDDMTDAMERCRVRNVERGRYEKAE